MILLRIKSILLVAVGSIAGSAIVLLLHWAWRSSQHNIPTPTSLAFSNRTITIHSASSRVNSRPGNLNNNAIGLHLQQVPDDKGFAISFPNRLKERTIDKVSTTLGSFPSPAQCHGTSIQVTADNVFLYHAICNMSNGNEIAQFSGHSMSHLFDKGNSKLYYTINEKLRTWSEVAKQLNETQSTGRNQSIANGAVHMHNTHKLGDFMLLFWTEYFRFGPNGRTLKQGKDATPLNAAQFTWAIDKNQPPVVITNWGDENWGHLSARKYECAYLCRQVYQILLKLNKLCFFHSYWNTHYEMVESYKSLAHS